MTRQEQIRAQIIAAQAAREAASASAAPKRKPRPNWAASPPMPPRKPFGRRPVK